MNEDNGTQTQAPVAPTAVEIPPQSEPTPPTDQENGAINYPPSFNLELMGIEVQLLHNMLTNNPFPTVDQKQVAASIQQKIEALAGQQSINQ